MKTGKVVLVLGGRFAGRKAIVVKAYDDGSSDRAYSHALIAGIDKYPLPVSCRLAVCPLFRILRVFLVVDAFRHFLVRDQQKVAEKVFGTAANGQLKKAFWTFSHKSLAQRFQPKLRINSNHLLIYSFNLCSHSNILFLNPTILHTFSIEYGLNIHRSVVFSSPVISCYSV